MICPECRAEYRDGFDRCDECEIPLVAPESLAPDEPPPNWVELLRSSDQSELTVLKGLLASAGIDHRVRGEEALHLYPVTVPGFFRSRGLAAVVDVRAEELATAQELLVAEVEEPAEER